MEDFIAKIAEMPLVAQILAAVVGFNLVVLGAVQILEIVKDKTTTTVDDKIYSVLTGIQRVLSVLVAYKK